MRELPTQQQTISGTFEYEFDVAGLLNASDTIASVDWSLPEGLTLENSTVNGTTITAYIAGNGNSAMYATYPVSFTINSVGAPTPVNPTLTFMIKIVKHLTVKVV